MAILIDENTKVLVQGITGSLRRAPRQTLARIRHQNRRRRHSRARAAEMFENSVPIFDTVGEAVRNRSHRLRDLRAAGLRRRCHPRSRRCRGGTHRLHHRGHPGHGHDARESHARRLEVPPGRPELPGSRHSRPRRESHGGCRIGIAPATSTSAAMSAWSPAPAPSPTRPSGSSPSSATARAPASASAATRSTAPPTSTCWKCSTRTRKPRPSS
jgi:hypothetical protein